MQSQPGFSLPGSFELIDRFGSGKIDSFVLYSFLRELGHFASNEELAAIVRRIDTDGDELVSYREFESFLPYDNPRQTQLRAKVSPIQYLTNCHLNKIELPCLGCKEVPVLPSAGNFQGAQAADQLLQAFQSIAKNERELSEVKRNLMYKVDFNLVDAFKMFESDGYITFVSLRKGLDAIGVYPTKHELELFLKRFDKNRDRKLNFDEYAAAFLPSDNYMAQMLSMRPSNHRKITRRPDECFDPETQIQYRHMWITNFKTEQRSA